MAKLIKRKPSKICPCCLKRFFKKKNESKKYWETKNYCSPKCGKLRLPIEEYKQKKLEYILSNTITTESGCMEWQGYCFQKTEYGQIYLNKRTRSTHTAVWELTKGIVPKGLCVLHTCDNRKCININHLFLGTHQDNADDMTSKNRQARGLKIHCAKLSEKDKNEIIQFINEGIDCRSIAKKFKISLSSLSSFLIKNGIRKGKLNKSYRIERNNKIQELFNSGANRTLIAKEFGISRICVYQIINSITK